MSIIIRFVAGEGIVSDTIRRFEYGFWASHAEALLPDGAHLLGAYMDQGVAIQPRDYDKGTFTREQYVSIDATQEQTDKFYAFLHSQLGKPYDKKAVLGIALGRDWRDPGQWFCSELQGAACEDCGVLPTHMADALNHLTPRDLLLILSGRPDFRIIT